MRRILLLVASFFLAASCGALRFQHAWSSYDVRAEPAGMAGRWQGEWRSEWNGHSGGLRCLMTQEDEACYRAWFYSTYAGLFFFQYETVLRVTDAQPGSLSFAGEQDLGAAVGGLYRYEGTAEAERFHATFQAANGDHGVFEMQRVD